MDYRILIYIVLMAATTYSIRVLPMILIRSEIKNIYIKSFLYYVPYVTLAVMTFPAILKATASVWSAAAGFATALILAFNRKSLFMVAFVSCASVFLVECFIV